MTTVYTVHSICLYTFPLSMFTHTLYLSTSTQSRYLSTHKHPIDLSTHSLPPSPHILPLSISLYTPSFYLHTQTHTHTHCLSVFLLHFTFFNLAVSVGAFVFFVYNVNDINLCRGLDALGINSVCSALCY